MNSLQFVILISTFVMSCLSLREQSFTHQFLPDPIIPEECLDQEYCEYVPNYPEELAAGLVAKLSKWGQRKKSLDNPKIPPNISPLLELCDVTRKIVTPKAAKDTNGRWHFILNPKHDPVQSYQEIRCSANYSSPLKLESCNDNWMFFSGTSEGRCQQKKNTVLLKTIDRYGNVQLRDNFTVYCCCVCNGYIGID